MDQTSYDSGRLAEYAVYPRVGGEPRTNPSGEGEDGKGAWRERGGGVGWGMTTKQGGNGTGKRRDFVTEQ